ncbi:MAG: undecaprenyl/decaprenyl-phosphate alpha-N-acetylglucosaminyl 1-phosphate transferase [Armatimonadetes bacterium]|nr:undecaprenyl/decaprenyl-phosphate alpha-N-acetylglucosaminyl 1-phosphate transferase [Armatimonadota bacterium]
MSPQFFYCVLAFILAGVGGFVLTPLARQIAFKAGVVREPRARDIHKEPMPLWGGLAIYASTIIVFLALTLHRLELPVLGILLGGTLIAFFGMLDDRYDLSAKHQLLAICSAAALAVAFGVRITFVSNPFGPGEIDMGMLSIPVTIAWIFFITKAVDVIDGLDGLAAGISAIASGTLALMALTRGQVDLALLAATLSGSCVGFLKHNFNPARIFMGTVGAQFLGFSMACIAVAGLFKVAATVAISLPVLVLGVPVFDAVFVTLKRLVRGQPLFAPEKGHVHHILVRRGLSQRQAVLVLYAVSLCFSLVAWQVFVTVAG